jgi:uncharacterized peroxidase-related enzyme
MAWIKTISFEDAQGKLKKLYNRVKGPNNNIDNVLKIHSLRPHTLNGHMVLYKSVLHHSNNVLPKWYLELLGTYVSKMNSCQYCFDHHAQGIKKNLQDDSKFELIIEAIKQDSFDNVLNFKMIAGCEYAKMLTLDHSKITETTIKEMKESGLDDGEILEINQLVSYFNYVNRMVVGLGVDTEGDIIGLSPNDNNDEENWTHL